MAGPIAPHPMPLLLWRKAVLFLGFGLLALLIIGVVSAVWGAIVYLNLKTSPSIPWCLAAIILVLWLLWQYLGGKGPPRSTAAARKVLLRANPVPPGAMAWSFVAGVLAIGALAGLWIVLFQLFKMPPNVLLPAAFTSSPLLIAGITVGASLVAPITEEAAIRGYLQGRLEREFRPVMAVALSSVVFAVAHVTQDLAWPKFLLYFLVGVTFGALAYFNDSILPVIPVHIVGDLSFFLFVWPHDSARKLVSQGGATGWFWIHVAQAIGLGALSLLAFRKLERLHPRAES